MTERRSSRPRWKSLCLVGLGVLAGLCFLAAPSQERDGGIRGQSVQEGRPAPPGASLAPIFLSAPPEMPLEKGVLTCGYGYRQHPISGKLDFHTGVDLAAAEGSPIRAIYPGVVCEVGESEVYGKYLILDHGHGLQSKYCHCSRVLAPLFAKLRQGETVALVGSTGLSTGAHLHLTILLKGVCYDPAFLCDKWAEPVGESRPAP